MEYLLEAFGSISLGAAIIFIAAIVFVIGVFLKFYNKLVSVHDNRQEREQDISELKEGIKEVKDAVLNLTKEQISMREEQKKLNERQQKFEEESRTINLNKQRDRILQSYRYYTSETKNPRHAWSIMEKETFDSLFADYEKLGGNGTIHSVVAPAMMKLDILYDEDEITELNKSRKG